MANLVETPVWEPGIYQFEQDDVVLGGPDGLDNVPGKQLANRTQWLKQEIESAQGDMDAHLAAADPHPQYLTEPEGSALIAAAVAALINSSPATLDTLAELATALGSDPNFATTITNALAGKQPLDQTLTALAALATVADRLIYATGADTFAVTAFTAFARTLLDDADAATARATLGAAGLAVVNTFTKGQIGNVTAFPATTGSVALDLNQSNNWEAALTGNITLANPSAMPVGQSGVIRIINDPATPRTIAFGSYWKSPSGSLPSLTGSNNAVDLLPYYVQSLTHIWVGHQGDVK